MNKQVLAIRHERLQKYYDACYEEYVPATGRVRGRTHMTVSLVGGIESCEHEA